MSLGLESAGFHRVLANEISPMAAETFAYNLVSGARGAVPPKPGAPEGWSPHFVFIDRPRMASGEGMDEKAFRNWHHHVRYGEGLSSEVEEVFKGRASSNLLVGHAARLRPLLEEFRSKHPGVFRRHLGPGAIDLLAGGPPCQSFSLAGKRQKDHPRNRLFEAFVEVVEIVRPKVVLFENVLGITRPFVDESGDEWHPWHEVCRAFKRAGYFPVPSLVNAADFGVPQSRPRFILVAIEEGLANKIMGTPLDKVGLAEALRRARTRYEAPDSDRSLLFRPETDIAKGLWPSPLFPKPTSLGESDKVTLRSAIGDLRAIERGEPFEQGIYAKELDGLLKCPEGVSPTVVPKNHGPRKHGDRTRARFRLLRTLAEEGFWAKSMGEVVKRRHEALRLLVGKPLLVPASDGKYVERKRANTYEVGQLIDGLASAKNVQKCLNPDKPAGAQLSIPDDSIHWEAERVLTIREMARIQSFPDWFEFRSKETTGGSARAYEVPQYTQVGNAVPPLLALAFGKAIRDFLAKLG